MAVKAIGRNGKKLSVSTRFRFHSARLNDKTVTKNKRLYSREWIDGYTDSHPRENYFAVCSEIKRKRGRISKEHSIMLNGFRNGLKAQLNKSANVENLQQKKKRR
jgi:hypothetical protein